MEITIIGPGIMEIPPKGWGAVEILIHDYRRTLEGLGHKVNIINTKDRNEIIRIENSLSSDFVHLQYDDFIDVIPHLECPNIAATTHYGYLEQPERWGGYRNIFQKFVNSDVSIFCLSEGIKNIYMERYVDPSRLHVVPNGVSDDLFSFKESPEFPDRSIYLAKIDYRKRQHVVQHIPNLYFAGNLADNRFNRNSPQYLGEWSKEFLYKNLTDYANLILLSDGEAHPLVCLEAMSAGLGLVLSEAATANLDLQLPFIDVIPAEKMNDISYISDVISSNREISLTMRNEIRDYVVKNFSWKNIVTEHYLPKIKEAIG